MLDTLDSEFMCLPKDLRSSDHTLNEFKSFGGREMMADFSEIYFEVYHINIWVKI